MPMRIADSSRFNKKRIAAATENIPMAAWLAA